MSSRRGFVAWLGAAALIAAAVVSAVVLTRGADPRADREATGAVWVDTDLAWGTVSGRVADSAGQAVSGAEVVAQDLRGFGGLATTGADGSYRIVLAPCSDLGALWPGRRWGEVSVPPLQVPIFTAASHPDFVHTSFVEGVAERGSERVMPPLTLWRGGRVRGHVVASTDGGPVAARVRVVGVASVGYRPPGLEGVGTGHPTTWIQTDADGQFKIEDVAPGRVELWATGPGQGGGSAVVVLAEGGEAVVRLVVDLQVHLAGRVLDADGQGVAGVSVACTRDRRPDEEAGATRKPVREDRSEPGRLEQGNRSAVGGRVRPFGRRPRSRRAPRDDSVLARTRQRGAFRTTTDDRGAFGFFAVDSSQLYTVTIVGAANNVGTTISGLVPSRADLILRMPVRRPIVGRIVSAADGKPIEGCVIQILPAQTSAYLVRSLPLDKRLRKEAPHRSGADGRFRIGACFSGEHELLFAVPGFEIARTIVSVDGESGGDPAALVTRLEPGAVLHGTLRGPGGEPARSGWVDAVAVRKGGVRPAPGSIQWVGRMRAACDAKGNFRLEGLPSGVDLRIRARDGAGNAWQDTRLLGPRESAELNVTLSAPGRMVVRLTPQGGGTRRGHRVRIQGIDDPSIDIELRSDSSGLGRVQAIPPGRYRVLAVHPKEDRSRAAVGARVREVDVESGEDLQLPIEVADVAVLTGTLLVGGKPVRVARIGFGPIDGTEDHFEPLLLEVEYGRFKGRLPPGTYHVNVNLPGRRHEVEEPVVVPNEANFSLDLALEGR